MRETQRGRKRWIRWKFWFWLRIVFFEFCFLEISPIPCFCFVLAMMQSTSIRSDFYVRWNINFIDFGTKKGSSFCTREIHSQLSIPKQNKSVYIRYPLIFTARHILQTTEIIDHRSKHVFVYFSNIYFMIVFDIHTWMVVKQTFILCYAVGMHWNQPQSISK